jgi:hypothetical protein
MVYLDKSHNNKPVPMDLSEIRSNIMTFQVCKISSEKDYELIYLEFRMKYLCLCIKCCRTRPNQLTS